MLRTGTRAAFALFAVPILAGAAQAAGRDKVRLVNGRSQDGIVVKDNAKGVGLRLGGGRGAAEYSRGEVAEVEYAGTPNEYRVGISQFKNGNYESAINYLDMALDRPHHELLKQYILYYVAKSHQKLGESDKAIPAFEGIFQQGTKSRFLVDAAGSLVELYCDVGRVKDARRMVRKLPDPRTRAEKLTRLMLSAIIEEKAKAPKRAIRIYKQVQGDARGTNPEAGATAAVGVARCMLALKKHKGAAQEVQRLVRAGKLGGRYAEAYLILGDALMATAKTDEDYEAAILAYLRVPALYPGNEATEAKALFEAGRAYRRIRNHEDAKNRAAKLFGMLRHKYPNSSYSEKAPR